MSYPATESEIVNSLKTLAGYLEDLTRTTFEASTTKLRLVVNFARKEVSLRGLAAHLQARLTTEELLREVMEGSSLALPEHPLDRLAFVYQLLVQLKQGWKLNLREVLTRPELSGGGMDQRWERFGRDYLEPMRGDLLRLHAWAVENLTAGSSRVDAGEVFARALEDCFGAAPGRALLAGAPAGVSAAAPPLELGDALSGLAGRIAKLPASSRADAEIDLRLLKLEQNKSAPSPTRLAELEASFQALGVAEDQVALAPEAQAAPSAEVTTAAPAGPEATPPTPSPTKPNAGESGEWRRALEAERVTLAAERASLSEERDALAAERTALTKEREALARERAALMSERESITRERAALDAERSSS